MKIKNNKDMIVGVRVSKEFSDEFNNICDEIGRDKSKILRLIIKEFISDVKEDSKKIKKIKEKIF